jgi:coenzyme PQQ precursor peptide PqqA
MSSLQKDGSRPHWWAVSSSVAAAKKFRDKRLRTADEPLVAVDSLQRENGKECQTNRRFSRQSIPLMQGERPSMLSGGARNISASSTLLRPVVFVCPVVLEESMKLEWHTPVVIEQEVGLEVTSYLPAELDRS